MLNQIAFANSLAVLAGFFYVVMFVLGFIAPSVLDFFFEIQFVSEDIVQIPSFSLFAGGFVVIVAVSWIWGYLWAWLYNRFSK